MTVAIVCTALLGLLVFGLGFAVSFMRSRTGLIGYGSEAELPEPLYKTVRAHGNTTEYAAMLSVLFLLVAYVNPVTWAYWAMALSTASRYLIAVGLMFAASPGETNLARFVGGLGTYIGGFALCGAVLVTL